MNMNRRLFMKGMGAFLGVCYVNPLSLSVPISMKKPSGNMLISPSDIAKEALTLLENNLVFNINHFTKGGLNG